MALHNKKIILGITGGIAAYKCAHLVRLLVKAGAEVKVIMTVSAKQFVTAETLSVLSKNQVTCDFFDLGSNWNSHVEFAEWADLIIIAPATANTMAKFANGICDNLLCAVYLSAKSKVYIAPAMDLDMYQHPSTKSNLITLSKNGNIIIPAESGELASGLIGEGRMAEPERIVLFIESDILSQFPFYGKKILINAGPTFEAIDPVRFIGNRSSGKTGIELADEFASKGAEVTLVLGPSALRPHSKNITLISVESAEEMYQACLKLYSETDIAILSAAVADYTPKNPNSTKIKKSEAELNIELIKTRDILAELGMQKKNQILIGFALETNNALDYAKDKLKCKNLDAVIVNTTSEKNPAFGSDFNTISILDKHNKLVNFELKSKKEIAGEIAAFVLDYLKK